MHPLIMVILLCCSKPIPLKGRLSCNCKKRDFFYLFKKAPVLSISFQ